MEWKQFNSKSFLDLKDDKNYLVVWIDGDGRFSRAHLAYWSQSDELFFSLENNNFHPILVHYYLEYPDINEQKKIEYAKTIRN